MIRNRADMLTQNLQIGKRYRINYIAIGLCKGGRKRFEGILIDKLDKFLVFRNDLGYKECFLKIDFAIGEYSIKEVE